MYYQIKNTLTECSAEDIDNRKIPYVANISLEEFEEKKDLFDMGIDLDLEAETEVEDVTAIQVNYDSLTGCFAIPDFTSIESPPHTFLFAIDERGIVILDDDGTAQSILSRIQASKRWKFPSLERFLYDFLEGIVTGDLITLEKYEKEMDSMEDRILAGDLTGIMERLVDIRSELLDLRTHYEQLIDLGQELEENENAFFSSKNLRFFRLFIERAERLQSNVTALREHTMQVRDLYHSQLEVKQNRNMSFLTIIATIFTPLTLITGWYGMNFTHMPELDSPYAYPIVGVVCLTIVVTCLIILKKKKWF
ncbi:MAG: magnesium transporter CorA [Lachnospiraceae bacterium]|nr:magnesium transporter CorA [Lachnospiraceae bacterium]